jgi:murein DD-endopeptidase MepM/ murein hydrolase activator NlpD
MANWLRFWNWMGPLLSEQYPCCEESPYRLPWKDGLIRLCVQGNRGLVSHRGREKYAYDFLMPVGSVISAARAGVVSYADASHHGRGFRAPNNAVCVLHEDATTAWYLHLKQGGLLVAGGDRVEAGQPIALSGNVGRSLFPHLHFEVTSPSGLTVPVAFADLPTAGGIPRMFRRYRSGNGRD